MGLQSVKRTLQEDMKGPGWMIKYMEFVRFKLCKADYFVGVYTWEGVKREEMECRQGKFHGRFTNYNL